MCSVIHVVFDSRGIMTNKTCIKFCELSFGGMRLLLCLLFKTLGVIDILDEDGGDDCRVQLY